MRKINFRKTRVFIFAIAAIMLMTITQNVFASTEEWLGLGNDYKWRTNGNWQGAFGIDAHDDLVFGERVCGFFNGCRTTFRRSPMNNDFPVNTSFDSIHVFGMGFRFFGNQIFLENGIEVGQDFYGGDLRPSDPVFNFNIILGKTQTWKNFKGITTFEGVVNLDGHVLTTDVDTEAETRFDFLINGTGRLEKIGGGTISINGAANNFGRTTILDGAVQVAGSLGNILLISGEVQGKGYTGSIDSSTSASGSISPGDSLDDSGVLHVSGFVDLRQNDVLKINLNGPTLGSQYDQLQVSNDNVRIIGSRLELSLGFVPTPGQQFTIVRQIGAGDVLGQFDQGNVIVENNQLFFITYLADRVILTAQGPVGP